MMKMTYTNTKKWKVFLFGTIFGAFLLYSFQNLPIYKKGAINSNAKKEVSVKDRADDIFNFPIKYFDYENLRWYSSKMGVEDRSLEAVDDKKEAAFRGEYEYGLRPTKDIKVESYSNEYEKFDKNVVLQARTVQTDEFDVDGDGQNEEILTLTNTGGNHPPHGVNIIKNGRIIFSYYGFQPFIAKTNSGNGFYLHWTSSDQLDWGSCCPTGYMKTRFVYEDGVFRPVWEQEIKYFITKSE